MITKIIFTILFLTELIFAVWNIRQKDFHKKGKMFTRLSLAGLLMLGLLCGILDGTMRYLCLIILLVLQSALTAMHLFLLHRTGKPLTVRRQCLRTAGALILFFFALIPAFLFPQYRQPQVTGSYAVTTEEFTWTDENRIETYADTQKNRSVTVKMWYPQEEGSFPLVVFSHGATGMIDSNFSTCQDLASNGYVVASIGHPYQAMMVKDTDGNVTFIDPEFLSDVTDASPDTPERRQRLFTATQEWIGIRSADMNFVLDTILSHKAAGTSGACSRVDETKIGLFGHSLGGAAAVNVGRQRTDIDAVIDLEGTMLGEYTGCENGVYSFEETPYPIPLLDVSSRAVYDEAKALAQPGYVNFYVGEHASDFREVIFNDAAHLNFTDLPLVSPFFAKLLGVGSVDAGKCIEQMNEMVRSYFNYYLKDAAELVLSPEY